jgi:spore coat protein A
MDRRKFITLMGAAGAAAAIPWKFNLRQGLQWASANAFMVSPGLSMFTEPLRGVTGATGIPVAASDGAAEVTGVTHYTINIGQFTDTLHATFGQNTTLWGFHPNNVLVGSATPRHLGGIILARRGTPIQITFRNNLTANGLPTGTPLQSISGHLHPGRPQPGPKPHRGAHPRRPRPLDQRRRPLRLVDA